eukprot:CAMPEP_0180507752 /NCGR_PEP_ID=MMETSP1036_2-20121128/48783_1 /TAXON_ID=632150 /ORGANISM="Azadinium spinosum, Strain 3D9" /LENGTH=288 /DNA_ID=CAMNT_0022517967 /DNA_START=1 /DNA_END=864 /DNA_ORIENTATION=+
MTAVGRTVGPVAFVGLGRMGWHMAQRLHAHFPPVLVHARTEESVSRHVSTFQTRRLADWHDLTGIEYLFLCLPSSAEVEEVVASAEPHLPSGSIVVDCTSGDPDATLSLGQRLRRKGVAFVDAPLSGGPRGAEVGALSVMMGGEDVDVARCRHLFEPLARTVEHVGSLSAGHAIKAVNNGLATISMLAAGEGLVALKRRGVDIGRALTAINASSGRSWMTEELLPKRVTTRSFDHGFALSLMLKDVRIAQAMAVSNGKPPVYLDAAERAMAQAVEAFGPEADLSEALR